MFTSFSLPSCKLSQCEDWPDTGVVETSVVYSRDKGCRAECKDQCESRLSYRQKTNKQPLVSCDSQMPRALWEWADAILLPRKWATESKASEREDKAFGGIPEAALSNQSARWFKFSKHLFSLSLTQGYTYIHKQTHILHIYTHWHINVHTHTSTHTHRATFALSPTCMRSHTHTHTKLHSLKHIPVKLFSLLKEKEIIPTLKHQEAVSPQSQKYSQMLSCSSSQ